MAEIQLNLKKSMFVPKFYPLLFDYSHRWEVYRGSAGSSKSYFITQKLIVRACSEKIRILVCRKTLESIRKSCFNLFKQILDKWQLTQYVKIRETDMTITFGNGSEILFLGLDDEHKLLSINNVSCVFVEECYDVPKNMVEQLNLRMRGEVANKQIIMAFNPVSRNSWLFDFLEVNPPEGLMYTHSTYKDNPFLDAETVAAYDEMEIRNPDKYRVYGRGEWGVDSEGLVIKNWRTEEFDAMALAASGLEHRCGMDVGWIDPTAIVNTLYDRDNKTIYIFEEFYKSGCQLEEISSAIGNMNIGKTKLYVDSAEPRTVQYLRTQGINAVPATKGKDSVKAGLMFLQDHLIIVHPKCEKVIMELENFCYIKSKQTGEFTEETDHTYSHSIDSIRYAYSDIYTNNKIKVIDKNLFF